MIRSSLVMTALMFSLNACGTAGRNGPPPEPQVDPQVDPLVDPQEESPQEESPQEEEPQPESEPNPDPGPPS